MGDFYCTCASVKIPCLESADSNIDYEYNPIFIVRKKFIIRNGHAAAI